MQGCHFVTDKLLGDGDYRLSTTLDTIISVVKGCRDQEFTLSRTRQNGWGLCILKLLGYPFVHEYNLADSHPILPLASSIADQDLLVHAEHFIELVHRSVGHRLGLAYVEGDSDYGEVCVWA